MSENPAAVKPDFKADINPNNPEDVKDAMLDFRLENKAQMAGLHLDLIRLGSTWRQEMRESLQEYMDDLHDLREENKRLREENERLRRGY